MPTENSASTDDKFEVTFVTSFAEQHSVARAATKYYSDPSMYLKVLGVVFAALAITTVAGVAFDSLIGQVLPNATKQALNLLKFALVVAVLALFGQLISGWFLPLLNNIWQTQQPTLPTAKVRIDDQAISWNSASHDIVLHWARVDRLVVTIDAVNFFISPLALSVPKRALQGNQAVKEFVLNALAHMSPQARANSLPSQAIQALIGTESPPQNGRQFQVTYQPTMEDFASVQIAARPHIFSPTQQLVWIPLTVAALALAAAAFWSAGLMAHRLAPDFQDQNALLLLQFIVAIGACVLFINYVHTPITYKLSQRWLAERYPPSENKVEANDDKISWFTAQADFHVRWSGVERIFMTPTTVVLLARPMAFFIPTCEFSAGGLQAFINEALTHMTPNARDATLADPDIQAVLRQSN